MGTQPKLFHSGSRRGGVLTFVHVLLTSCLPAVPSNLKLASIFQWPPTPMGIAMQGILRCASTLCVGLSLIGPASALSITETFSGTASGSGGIFGGQLTNVDYTATYVFDSTLGSGLQYNILNHSNLMSNQLYGGPAYGTSSPATSAILTINGISSPNLASGVVYTYTQTLSYPATPYVFAYADVQGYSYTFNNSVMADGASAPVGVSLTGSFSYNVQPGDGATGQFISGTASLSLSPTLVSLSVSTVPLPPSLSLFAIALVALGAVGFYAHKKQSAMQLA